MSKAKSLSEVLTEMIKEIDLVCVVRCKDCKHWYPTDYCTERDGLWYENDYCSMGERGDADDETGSDRNP